MKTTKKLIAMLLSISVIFAMSFTAFADTQTTGKIIVPDDGHAYSIYQIMTGEVNNDGTKLSDAKWGSNANGKTAETDVTATEMSALMAITGTPIQEAKSISAYVNLEGNPLTTIAANANPREASVPFGYYLIKDNGPATGGDEQAIYIAKIVGLAGVTVDTSGKKSTTSSEKKVMEKNDTTGASTWQDAADYDIGDMVPFKITTTLTESLDAYTTYPLTIHDKQDAGLSFKSDSVVVSVDGDEIDTGYTVKTSGFGEGEDCTFEIIFSNVKAISGVAAGSVITVEYKSTLLSNAVSGKSGNSNESYVSYANNPYGDGTGTTTPDITKVFTYDLSVTKYKNEVGEGKELPGAGFTLYKLVKPETGDASYVAVGSEKFRAEATSYLWAGLDAGQYKLVETTTPDGYNTMAEQFFTISGILSYGAAPSLTGLQGTAALGSSIGFTVDEGLTTLSTDIINYEGAALPTTGGLGTKLLYLFGSILALGAAVMYTTRRRVNAER